uniref:ATP synthase F0 subunit 8 n=1 Tax=Chelonibia testudinaria TaxID=217703 RepID=A0A0U1WQW5_CHETS|nr:ATP synthase F0 subunit 8 [Chelonibia testudinaria]AII19551.1 ATP synthase F0 subunit 8 [Chelonibia testudinaria]
MPHMAPIMWAFIMVMTFSSMLVLLSMIYFMNSPISPESEISQQKKFSSIWLW